MPCRAVPVTTWGAARVNGASHRALGSLHTARPFDTHEAPSQMTTRWLQPQGITTLSALSFAAWPARGLRQWYWSAGTSEVGSHGRRRRKHRR